MILGFNATWNFSALVPNKHSVSSLFLGGGGAKGISYSSSSQCIYPNAPARREYGQQRPKSPEPRTTMSDRHRLAADERKGGAAIAKASRERWAKWIEEGNV